MPVSCDVTHRVLGWSALGVTLVLIATGALARADEPADGADLDAGLARAANAHAAAVRLDPPPRSFTVIAGGDVLTEERVRLAAGNAGAPNGVRFDFGPMFEQLRDVIGPADLAICHMETPVGAAGGGYGLYGRSPFGGNLLLAPYEVTLGLRSVGFDRCSTASNHANDLGATGIDSTIDVLHSVGLGFAGTARSADEAAVSVFEVNHVKVAHLAYTTSSNTVAPADSWRLNTTRDPARIAADVAAARRAGAEVVLLSVHLSVELQAGPTAADRTLVTAVTSMADVDAVFVHGPHVVQPFEIVNDTPVWWSLGNFVSEMGPPSVGRYADPNTSDGLLAFVRFVEGSTGEFWVQTDSIAICNDLADRTVRSATIGLDDPDLPARVRAELAECLARTRTLVPTAR